ncbi:peptidase U32 family protein [Halobacteriovorax sp. HLS]|uniref:peptidase U32 family protein n=1 Tax=Halobacteriovorax sp. HLS TaxID=2234000 RepID=UPI000FDA118A|nr:U32 family peptidase [Halobacteriovorax sp. HLS]
MKIISPVDTIEQAMVLKENQVKEVIVGHMLFSRFGKVSPNRYNEFTAQLKEMGFRVIFDWDILMTETIFNQRIDQIAQVDFSNIDAVRVQDAGALNWIKNNKNLAIQLVLENGNHNLIGIKKWIELAGNNLERVVLSIELPKNILKEYIQEINIPIEFLAFGRILLFYTPRSLVSPFILNNEKEQKVSNQSYIELAGSSEESPHKGFPIVENIHGTFMFNTKDHYLCEHIEELMDIGIDTVRIDLRHVPFSELVSLTTKQLNNPCDENARNLKEAYPGTIIRGFYHVNKSDILFKKLKNQITQRTDKCYIGEVLDVKKKKHIAIMVKSRDLGVEQGSVLILKTPDGKVKEILIDYLLNSKHEQITKASTNEICFIKHVSGVSVKTAVYLKE